MTADADQIVDGETLTVQIPLRLRKRGGRKLMVVPEGATPYAPQRARVDSAMVKATARAHRWRRMLEDGTYGTIAELAAAEKINEFLRGPSAAVDAAGAGNRRSDTEWTAICRRAIGLSDEAVSGGMEGAGTWVRVHVKSYRRDQIIIVQQHKEIQESPDC